MSQVTIAGHTFEVGDRYAEGHTLDANEAASLNQTLRENIRNNFAAQVKKAKEDGTFDQADLQSKLDEYARDYQFGVRTGGGSRDPVETEAMDIARQTVREALKRQGKSVSDYSAKQISEAAAKLVAKNPVYRERARERIAEMQSVAGDVDVLGTLEATPAGESNDESPAPRRRRTAEAAE